MIYHYIYNHDISNILRNNGHMAKIGKDFQPYIYNIWRQLKGNDPEIVRAVKKKEKKKISKMRLMEKVT